MSMFAGSDLLEEIVETTEEQEADLCSSGETVDECTGLPIIGEFVEDLELEQKHQPHLDPLLPDSHSISSGAASAGSTGRQHKSGRSVAGAGGGHHQQQQQHQNVTLNGPSGRAASRSLMEKEKRMRREIANSNERRRMQSINAGFQSLRTLLPHHEGEKLSKAAILQQTAEYIYQLEQQKTQLLSQNLQLKRLVDQHEGGDVPTKKRKHESHGVVVSLPVHVSESGDEGLGSMSPEPLSVITVSADGHATVASNEIAELKRQLERERMSRSHLEKQISAMQSQIFPERFREEQLIAYQPHEVIEHTNNVLSQELEDGLPGLQVVSVVSVPTVGSTQTVETSNADSNTPPLSPQTSCEIIVPSSCGPAGVTSGGPEDATVVVPKDVTVGELLGESRPGSPKIVSFAGVPVFASSLDEQSNAAVAAAAAFAAGGGGVAYAASLPAAAVSGAATVVAAEFKASGGQFIGASPIRAFSPEQDGNQQQRLPSVLEAAIKAEPKVEVERLPSPSNSLDDGTPQARLYLANTSRQNLETIVEAIRHLEGDHLFSDEPAQDVPLALTNKVSTATGGSSPSAKQRLLHAEVNSFLQFHTTQQQQQQQQQPSTQQQQQQQQPNSSSTSAATQATTATVVAAATAVASQQQTQQRPGVIVVKHS